MTCSDVFNINFEHFSRIVLVVLSLTRHFFFKVLLFFSLELLIEHQRFPHLLSTKYLLVAVLLSKATSWVFSVSFFFFIHSGFEIVLVTMMSSQPAQVMRMCFYLLSN